MNLHALLLVLGFDFIGIATLLFVDSDMINFAIFAIILLNMVLISNFVLSGSQYQIDLLNPSLCIQISYCVYSIFGIWGLLLGDYSGYFEKVYNQYYLCVAIGLIGFISGQALVNKRRINAINYFADIRIKLNYKQYFIVLFVFMIIFIILNLNNLLETYNINNVIAYSKKELSTRTTTSGLNTYLLDIATNLILVASLYWCFINRKINIWAWLPTIYFGLWCFKGGAKAGILVAVLLPIIYFNYYVKKLRLPVAISGFVILLLFFSVYQHARYTSDVSEMIELVQRYYGHGDWNLLLPIGSSEFSGPIRTLLYIMDGINSGRENFSYGLTWINELLVFIPSFVLPDRPLPAAEYFMLKFIPEARIGSGYGWFILSEGYWSFGIVGLFIEMFFYGAIVEILYRIFLNNYQNNGFVALLYSFVYLLLITAVRTGILGTIKTGIMLLAPYIIIYFVYRVYKRFKISI